VGLNCNAVYGDSYEVFAFMSYPHPVLAVLDFLGVTLPLNYSSEGWKEAWDVYDLKSWIWLLGCKASEM
jgi:hypothetical protein